MNKSRLSHTIQNLFLTLINPGLYNYFFDTKRTKVEFFPRLILLFKFFYISFKVECTHFDYEMLAIASGLFKLPKDIKGDLAEAGAFKGGSSAKLSLVAKILGKKLYIFDSFSGIPENYEYHSYLKSEKLGMFQKGEYKGSLPEVMKNIKKYGDLGVCTFIKGDFRSTMPKFENRLCGIFADVDLAFSTKAVLKYLYPNLSKGGLYATHDGHLKIVVDVYKNKNFWEKEVKAKKPAIKGLGKHKLLVFTKP